MASEEDMIRHQVVKNVDHLMISFQCELYCFRNLKGLDPEKRDSDVRLLRIIHRATLNVFWAREPSTIDTTQRDSKKIMKISRSLALDDTLSEMRPFAIKDTHGMGITICTLIRSLDKGKHESMLQFESVRKLCLDYSNA